jgi:hypothetical protein
MKAIVSIPVRSKTFCGDCRFARAPWQGRRRVHRKTNPQRRWKCDLFNCDLVYEEVGPKVWPTTRRCKKCLQSTNLYTFKLSKK